jgi:hypothetical protein
MLEVIMALADADEAGIEESGFRISNLCFVDGTAFLADGQTELHQLISHLHIVSICFGLNISTSKTEFQSVLRKPPKLAITIGGTVLKQMDLLTYLGRVILQDARCEVSIKRRINPTTGVAPSLNTIWESKDISTWTKVRVYRGLVMSVLMYNSETWTIWMADQSRPRVWWF